jgi:hypothetical protein
VPANDFRISFYGTDPETCIRIAAGIMGSSGSSVLPVDMVTDGQGGTLYTLANATTANFTTWCALNATGTSSTEFDYSWH